MTKRIILADNDDIQRGTYSSAIEVRIPNSIEIDEAEDGDQLVKMVKENDYSLIVTDYQMPRMDGLEAIRQIREFDKKTPICILSEQNVSDEASKLGATHISKDDFDKIEPILIKYLS